MITGGLANYFYGLMASTYGYASIGPTSFGFILMWLTYHASTKSKGFYHNNPKAIGGLIIRGGNNVAYLVLSTISYRFADKACIN